MGAPIEREIVAVGLEVIADAGLLAAQGAQPEQRRVGVGAQQQAGR
jgi:hypothetical protein